MIEVARRNKIADKVTHVIHPVDRERKKELPVHLTLIALLKMSWNFWSHLLHPHGKVQKNLSG
jgi:hypothetical protein